jgi:hypothetical protein
MEPGGADAQSPCASLGWRMPGEGRMPGSLSFFFARLLAQRHD